MNITEALNVALPELPRELVSAALSTPAPDIVLKEHIEEGKPVVRVFVPRVESVFTFPPGTGS